MNQENSAVIELAIQSSNVDWNSSKTRHLFLGCLGDGPKISKSGFYYCFFNNYSDERDSIYCEAYNHRTNELIETYGMPSWAPLYRLPSREEALSMLQNGSIYDDYQGKIKEKRKVEYIISVQEIDPKLYVRDEARQILLIAGDVNKSVGEIDIIDLENAAWMGSYQYLRKHVLKLPWDRELVVAK
jgi:hypothetical protein